MSCTLDWRGDEILQAWREKGMQALLDGGEKILAKANNSETPWSSGDLGGSGDVQPDGETRVVVSFNTPYAERQHEDASLRHPNPRDPRSLAGRKDHYLRDPAYELWDEILQDLADAFSE